MPKFFRYPKSKLEDDNLWCMWAVPNRVSLMVDLPIYYLKVEIVFHSQIGSKTTARNSHQVNESCFFRFIRI